MNLKHGIMKSKPTEILPEAKREYHIGLDYPHKPKYEGILYKVIYVPSAHLSDEYMELYRDSPYTDQLTFNLHQIINCPHCNSGLQELIDERRAPGA